ncbi:hypothetical protein [Caballeronia catudaia]|uniref:hypothetical protein n=1 Tax=Caballeronia catudaia TaxID=1777136 RepID=UPI00077240A9|nr:hypothetical protein [Caballeronia catudaia]
MKYRKTTFFRARRIVLARKKEGNVGEKFDAQLWRDYVNVTAELDAPTLLRFARIMHEAPMMPVDAG